MRNKLKWAVRLGGAVVIVAALVVTFNWAKIRRLLRVNSLFTEELIVGNFSNMRDMFFHVDMPARASDPYPLRSDPRPIPARFSFRGKEFKVADWMAERRVTAIVVLKNGKIAHEEYFLGTTPRDRRISWSMAKSVLSAAFGIAFADGKIGSLDEQVVKYVPSLKDTAYDGATIRNVLNMASGVYFNEDYLDYNSDINRMGRTLALGRSMDDFAASLKKRGWEPGSRNHYVSIDTHVLGMVLRAATGQTAYDYVADKVLRPLRLEADPYYLTDGYGVAFVLGGLNLRTRDYARFGLMFANGGKVDDMQVVPADWVAESTTPSAPPPIEEMVGTDDGLLKYGYQWWLAPDPREGEFFAHGIYGQFIYVDQTKNVVIATNGADLGFREGEGRVTLEHVALFRTIADGLLD